MTRDAAGRRTVKRRTPMPVETIRVLGVWMTWSDRIGPFVADPDWPFTLAAGVVERADYTG
jgi:hypothetical protein